MDKDTFVKYAPWIIIPLIFFLQYKIFVTPVEQEKLHREILQEVAQNFVTQKEYALQQSQINTMATQISKIYDKMFSTNK